MIDNIINGLTKKIYNYGVKKRNEYVKEREITNELKIEAKELETAAYYENLGKELKIKAIARAEARAKSKAYHPSKSSQIARVAEELSHIVRTDGPDPLGLFGERAQREKPASNRGKTVIIIQNGKAQKHARKKKQSVVRDDYFDTLP